MDRLTPEHWLEGVEVLTAAHRRKRARFYADRAMVKRAAARAEGWSREGAQEAGNWDASRAQGQRDRFHRVRDCGTNTLRVKCQACGHEQEVREGCSCRLLCVSCRGAKACQLRARFGRARTSAVEEAESRGLYNPRRRGGRYTEKLLTLTVPHCRHDGVAERIHRALDAFGFFGRKLQKWRRDYAVPMLEWFRVFEWTPGTDRRGHPHLHIWALSPYLDHELLRAWWTTALARAGYEDAQRPIVDIREVTNGESVQRELVKYLTKDIDAQGKKIPPELYAKVYMALDGRRVVQASRGFMSRAGKGPCACVECGASLPKDVRRERRSDAAGEGDS